MANVDRPRGFTLVGHIAGAIATPVLETFVIPATDAGNYFVGDGVISVPADTVNPIMDSETGLPFCKRAAAGAPIGGIIVGVLPLEDAPNVSITRTYRAASTAQKVQVCRDPNAVFEVQASAATLTNLKGVGENADILIGTGVTLTGRSGDQLDATTIATTASLQFRILDVIQMPDNAVGAFAVVRVKLNNCELGTGAGSVGL